MNYTGRRKRNTVKAEPVKRLTIGSSIVLAMLVFGFTSGGGKLSSLVYGEVLAAIVSFIMGSLVLAFGLVKPMQMVSDVFREPEEGYAGRLASHVLICECAARAALFGAAISGLMAVVSVVTGLGGDVSGVGYRLGSAAVAAIYGAVISALVFGPLKRRFLVLEKMGCPKLEPPAAKAVVKDFLLVTVGFGVTVYLVIAYLFKFIPFLVETLRR